jgi:hypothetical protein
MQQVTRNTQHAVPHTRAAAQGRIWLMPDGVAIRRVGEKLRGIADHTYGSKLTNKPMPLGVASGVASPSFGLALATPGHPSDTPLPLQY